MIRKLLLTLSLLLSLSAYSQSETVVAVASTPADTLLSARTANSISIVSTDASTSITVYNFDNSGDNFYYQTGKQRSKFRTQTRINYSDVTNVRVIETPIDITVSFLNPSGEAQTYTFPFSDPDNRTFKSYIGSKGSDFGFTISRSRTTKWSVISQGIGLGWVSAVDDNPSIGNSMCKSNELTWLMVLGVRMDHRAHSLEFGMGLNWQNFVKKGDHHFFKESDGRITLTSYEEGISDTRSRIKIFSLQFPLLYGISFGNRRCCSFKLGPILNFNTSGSIKTQYKFEGREYSIKTNHIGQRPVTVDAFAAFRYKSIGWYVRYSPMNELRDRTGFDFKSVSTGFMLAL